MKRNHKKYREYQTHMHRGAPLPPPIGKYNPGKPVIDDEALDKIEKFSLAAAGVILFILISTCTATLLVLAVDVFHHRGITAGTLDFWAALKIIIFAKLAWMLERAFTRRGRRGE